MIDGDGVAVGLVEMCDIIAFLVREGRSDPDSSQESHPIHPKITGRTGVRM
ncbi:hypothetical protein [Methanogenium cariaci]|uniref:hypothetical protein n=1 Tax=Methanogenium cariaci TaxID=2197 RepID=UPI0012F69909|nr:hypothetical protein [Methanogenium cariaci]